MKMTRNKLTVRFAGVTPAILACLVWIEPAAATTLTFDVDRDPNTPGIQDLSDNWWGIDTDLATYGDNVSSSPQNGPILVGDPTYGTVTNRYFYGGVLSTPGLVVSYSDDGNPNNRIRYRTSSNYGNLQRFINLGVSAQAENAMVTIKDDPSDSITTTPALLGFDLAAGNASGSTRTLDRLEIRNGASVIYSQNNVVVDGTTRTSFDFTSNPLYASSGTLSIVFMHTTGTDLNSFGLDNVQFIPEPSVVTLLGMSGLLLLRARRRTRQIRNPNIEIRNNFE